jgi:hypothetical protein
LHFGGEAFLMGWLPIFVDDTDAITLLRWLSDEPEIAFLLGDGPKRWKAVKNVDRLVDGPYALWQHTGEPLNLMRERLPDVVIPDPWKGWQDLRTGSDPTTPYCGAGHPSVFGLDLWARHRPYTTAERASLAVVKARLLGEKDHLSLSGFQWIGDHYQKAPQSTHRCWRRLKAWVRRSAAKLEASRTNFWAFPSALAKLQGGMDYDANNFDLSASLRSMTR